MYSEKPKYDITNLLNGNKVPTPVNASFWISKAPEKEPGTFTAVGRRSESTPSMTKSPASETKSMTMEKPAVPTFSAEAKQAVSNIGGKPMVVPKKRVMTEAQKMASQKLKALGAKVISQNKDFNSNKLK